MVEFSHVYKTYPGPVHALKNISMSIDKGEFVFLIGKSGAGKSTLFKLMSAYSQPTTGQVKISGHDVATLKGDEIAHFRRQVGVVYQDFKLLKDRNIFDNVSMPLQIRGEKQSYVVQRTNEVLDLVGLYYKKAQLPMQLSGGEKQRVAIARALVHFPGLLIADEPTGNLDPELSEEIMNLLEKVNAQGTTVFCATHNHELIRNRSKRVIKIESGILLDGAAS